MCDDGREIGKCYEMLNDANYEIEKLTRRLEVVTRERDAYKAYVDKIIEVQADALLMKLPEPIIVRKSR